LVARFSSRDLFAPYRADQAGARPVSHIMALLSCPKCDAPLRRFERSGVVIERCTHCRGVFLDRGELEHLIEVEGALLYDTGPGPTGRPITNDNPTTRVRARGKRKIPVTERILDLG
jgi:Zn-finger nucleic acid-binding protein